MHANRNTDYIKIPLFLTMWENYYIKSVIFQLIFLMNILMCWRFCKNFGISCSCKCYSTGSM